LLSDGTIALLFFVGAVVGIAGGGAGLFFYLKRKGRILPPGDAAFPGLLNTGDHA
jgi:hypothetical protein